MARGTALTRACAAEKLPPAAAHRPLTVHRLPAADGPALLPAAWTRTPPASTQPAPTPPAPEAQGQHPPPPEDFDGLEGKKPSELTPEELRLMADTMPGEGPGD